MKVNKGRVLISRVLVILGVILFIFFPITVLFSKYLYYRTLERKITNIEQEISLLRKENMRLKNEITMLYSPERIETLARERLGLTKSKELAFRVTDTAPQISVSPAASLPGAGSARSSAPPPRLSDKKDHSENLSNNEGTSHTGKEQEGSFWLERLCRRVYNKLRAIF